VLERAASKVADFTAFDHVSHGKAHVSIDGCAINPSFMVASEKAERALVAWQVAEVRQLAH